MQIFSKQFNDFALLCLEKSTQNRPGTVNAIRSRGFIEKDETGSNFECKGPSMNGNFEAPILMNFELGDLRAGQTLLEDLEG